MIWEWEQKAEGAKPCPFCGSTEIKTSKKDNYQEIFRCVHIKCDVCRAMIPGFGSTYEKAYEEALTMWNGRAS